MLVRACASYVCVRVCVLVIQVKDLMQNLSEILNDAGMKDHGDDLQAIVERDAEGSQTVQEAIDSAYSRSHAEKTLRAAIAEIEVCVHSLRVCVLVCVCFACMECVEITVEGERDCTLSSSDGKKCEGM